MDTRRPMRGEPLRTTAMVSPGWKDWFNDPESTLGIDEGQQSHNSGTLHRIGEIALLFCRQTCQTTGKNLATFGDELLKQIHILVIDGIAGLDRRKALLEEGTGHESGTVEKRGEQKAHLISLWRVILLS